MRWSSSRSADDEWASAKIVIAGAFGVGKTTAIGAISEVQVVGTEALMTEAAHGTEQPTDAKSLTTVAMDFGRRALDPDLTLYLFGTPGQPLQAIRTHAGPFDEAFMRGAWPPTLSWSIISKYRRYCSTTTWAALLNLRRRPV
jgi:GTPase SAR1 family protein